ncbi:phosphomannomutase [Aliidongia dinghuensis]|uniref:Phosphomannomutase n=1 Tax=Aliidongia dinghuensis TaxID=1867774 RepID=A0A8J3E4W9_9PROT|nr:phosphomannomutase/phosphoglucomutase [Aliidongia dinghuensis]GGF17711.1 phosphomannomutase [Aliidongia dinghuensis]
MSHQFDPTILREYDIRGIVGETLKAEDARAIGRSYGSMLARSGGKCAAIGYDGRLSSPMLEEATVQGLNEAGIDVVRIGRGPTPMLYYAVNTVPGVDGGIMITGSHNPPNYNGFKMMKGKKSFFGKDIQALGQVAAKGDWTSGQGTARQISVFDEYVARIAQDYDGKKPLKVVWDAGNGATGDALVQLVKKLPGTHILLNEVIDGTFPAHHPDPTEPHNLIQLQEKVAADKADLGIAFDGDGDRIGVIDAKGRILWGDQLMIILADDVLKAKPGSTIIADVKASQVLYDEIARMGGAPLMWRTGHSLIKSKMAETGAPLAGEMSGHIFFADRYYGYDDALYAAVRLLGIVARSDETITQVRDRLPTVLNTPELRFPCSETRKFQVIDEVKARLEAAGADVSAIDGVRVNTADGWWLLRASNTQDVLVARAEAKDEAGLARLKAILAEQLKASDIAPPAF